MFIFHANDIILIVTEITVITKEKYKFHTS